VILAIGSDLVSVDRIADALQRHGDRFAGRILTSREQQVYRVAPRPAAYLAKRFAIKEAASKALGTGIGAISWQDMETDNEIGGAPILRFSGAALRLFRNKGGSRVLVSVSDEKEMALAFVVLVGADATST